MAKMLSAIFHLVFVTTSLAIVPLERCTIDYQFIDAAGSYHSRPGSFNLLVFNRHGQIVQMSEIQPTVVSATQLRPFVMSTLLYSNYDEFFKVHTNDIFKCKYKTNNWTKMDAIHSEGYWIEDYLQFHNNENPRGMETFFLDTEERTCHETFLVANLSKIHFHSVVEYRSINLRFIAFGIHEGQKVRFLATNKKITVGSSLVNHDVIR